MEGGVTALQRWGKLQGDGGGVNELDDGEGAEVAKGHLGTVVVAGGEQDQVTDLEGVVPAVFVGLESLASLCGM